MKIDSKQNIFVKAIWLAMVLFVVLSGILSVFVNANAAATPPRMISYQGRILNANGVPISDASISMVFEFYDALAAGSCLWSNSASDCATATAKTVTLTDGLFTQNLGDTGDSFQAIPTTVFDDASVYLQVTIDGEPLTPRKMLVASPYSMNSDMLDGNDSTSFFSLAGDNTVSGINSFASAIFSGALPLVFEGATADDYETSFAITDTTLSDKTITFQNASGTVAFLNDIGWTDGGTTVYSTTATDSIAIGGTDATASEFGFVPSTGYMYLGDGATNPVMSFEDSTAGTGTITYNSDNWEFTGGDIIHTGDLVYGATPLDTYSLISTTTLNTAASGGAGTYQAYQIFGQVTNTAVENAGNLLVPTGIGGYAVNNSIGVVEKLIGVEAVATNNSTAATPIDTAMYGSYSASSNVGAGTTVPLAVGAYGNVNGSAGTITNAMGIYGTISPGIGTITRAYGGYFDSTSNGTSRYGVFGTASGGANNYAGYFYGATVQIDNIAIPSTPTYANGNGDLYVYDQIEVDGTGITGGFISTIVNDTLTTGSAIYVSRDNSGTDFINTSAGLVSLSMGDSASTGNTLYTTNAGTGYSLYVNQIGDQQAMYVSALGTTDYIASFFNDGNADTNMGISIQACLDLNPTSSCNYLLFKDGDGGPLGAIEGTGGGVALVSPGSDYAELFPGTMSDFSYGDVIGIDSLGNVIIANDADDIIGAYSISPNVIGNWFEGWQTAGTYVPVALLGQVPINVSDEGGAITAGDYLTLSSTPGVAKKATGVGYVIGRALEAHASGEGMIDVYVQPKWQAINVLAQDGSITTVNTDLALSPTSISDAVNQGFDSYGLMLRGSGWDGASAQEVSMAFVNDVTNSLEYKLSIRNTLDTEVGFINQDGDMAISGKFYPSDRGVLQTDKYIYYDGSSGMGGDFIRTNASGWGSGSYDFAEMFPAQENVAPGEVVIFADNKDSIKRSTGVQYDDKIAGIVSTQPGFLAGQNIDGHVPIALAGRVPTYVSGENGAISIGDPLTTSSTPGYAMKATQNGQIVGFAMEAFSGGTGSISVFVRPSYYNGEAIDLSDNVVTQVASSSTLDLSGIVNLNGGTLLSVGSIAGIGDMWSISEDGTILTEGRFVQKINSFGGNEVNAYAVTSTQTTIELSGTIELENGRAHVFFEDVDPDFNDIIDLLSPYRVFITAHGATGSLYATDRDIEGFIIRDTLGTSDIEVDWLVIAYHKDYAPLPEVAEDNIMEATDDEEVVENDVVSDQADDVIEDEKSTQTEDVDEQVITEPEVDVDQEPIIDEESVINEEVASDEVVEEVVDQSEPIDEVADEEIVGEVIAEPIIDEPVVEDIAVSEPEVVEIIE